MSVYNSALSILPFSVLVFSFFLLPFSFYLVTLRLCHFVTFCLCYFFPLLLCASVPLCLCASVVFSVCRLPFHVSHLCAFATLCLCYYLSTSPPTQTSRQLFHIANQVLNKLPQESPRLVFSQKILK